MLTKINLLPQEYRRKEMTPMGIFLPLISGFAVIVALGFFWGWLHFAALTSTRSERDALQAMYASKQPTLSYLASLRREESVYQQRADTISEIAASRTLWTRKLDELCDVIADDDGGERYLIRLDEMSVKEPKRTAGRSRGKKGVPEGELVLLKGYCFNDEDPLQRFNNFHEALKQSRFYLGDFLRISKPEGQVERPDEDLRPSKAWTVKREPVMRGKQPGKKHKRSRASASAAKKGRSG